MNQEKIGKFIAEYRKKNNMTQEILAEKLGVSKNAVSKWERGLCLMDMSLLKPLSEILGVSINDILAGEKIDNILYKERAEENLVNVIDESKRISKKRKKIIIALSIPLIAFVVYIIGFNILYLELPVRYDERVMRCYFENDSLVYRVEGLSVVGGDFVEVKNDDKTLIFFRSNIMLINKRRSHWETWEGMAKLMNGSKTSFASFHEIDIPNDTKVEVYYTDVSLFKIRKADNNKIKEYIKNNSYLMCKN
ncbi:MAG: helix-turn-helix transcriptional regulator [Bacilli bacterium]|nr:helix-turn-helix transcriptional regulator [Bacilli bacterium]